MENSIAAPYAKALFNLAKTENKLSLYLDNLNQLAGIINNSTMEELIKNPLIDNEKISQLLNSMINNSDPELSNFINLLINNKRLKFISPIIEIYNNLLLEDQNCLVAKIETAFDLTAETKLEVEEILSSRFNKKIISNLVLNPKLVAGLKITIDGKVIDGSMLGRLNNLATQLNK